MPERVSALTGFWTWLPLVGIFVFASKIQNALNEYWVHEGAPPFFVIHGSQDTLVPVEDARDAWAHMMKDLSS